MTCGAVSSTITGAVVVFLQTATEVLVGTVHAITSPQYLVNTNGRRIIAILPATGLTGGTRRPGLRFAP